ncbi:MAG: LysR family transcriptional regulator [Myxococcales bacterium FL481]|nr:MAG: LysR family transcriptional regulator [Myxococcales bacterium FL481]
MLFCMDWSKFAFDWNRARAFLVTAEEGSLSAAARALGQAQPTLGRQVTALEEELGVALFERVGHRLVLTKTGAELVEQVRHMSEAAARFSLIAAGQSQAVEGVVRLAASQAVAAYLLAPVIKQLRDHHPALEIEIVVSNTSSDLRRREADVAVRHYRPEGDDLVAKLVREVSPAHLYAAPSYLKRIGHPKTPEELADRACVLGFDERPRLLQAVRAGGVPVTDDASPIRVEDHLVQWELCKQGLGLGVMMEEVGSRERRVRRVLPQAPPLVTLPTWVVSHRELRTSRKIRVVFDALAEHLTSL